MKKINQEDVRIKVKKLFEAMHIPKHKLGELLGGKGDQQNVKINRANRFLRGEAKRISIESIERIADFFSLPMHYFLSESQSINALQQNTSGKGGDKVTKKHYETISKSLYKLGFDEAFISVQIEQLQAVQYCRNQNKTKKVKKK